MRLLLTFFEVLQQPHFWCCLIFYETSKLRRRLVGNLTGKSADSSSVEDNSPLLQLRLDLPATLPHDPSADCKRLFLFLTNHTLCYIF